MLLMFNRHIEMSSVLPGPADVALTESSQDCFSSLQEDQSSLLTGSVIKRMIFMHSLIHMKGTDNKNYNMGLKVA